MNSPFLLSEFDRIDLFFVICYKLFVIVYFRGSSNGRTTGFGPVNRGSSPCPRAKLRAFASFFCAMINFNRAAEILGACPRDWFMENRDCKKVLDDYFLIDKDKIINKK